MDEATRLKAKNATITTPSVVGRRGEKNAPALPTFGLQMPHEFRICRQALYRQLHAPSDLGFEGRAPAQQPEGEQEQCGRRGAEQRQGAFQQQGALEQSAVQIHEQQRFLPAVVTAPRMEGVIHGRQNSCFSLNFNGIMGTRSSIAEALVRVAAGLPARSSRPGAFCREPCSTCERVQNWNA
jgi:hypothetical protein